MPRVYVCKFEPMGGVGKIGVYGAYDDGSSYQDFSFLHDIDSSSPIKPQIDRQVIADFVNSLVHPSVVISKTEVEILS